MRLSLDDRNQHAAAFGARRSGDPGQPRHLHADRQGLAVRVNGLDGHFRERLPQSSVAGADGRNDMKPSPILVSLLLLP